MELRQIADTYFTAVPADIVGCVDDLIPAPVCPTFTETQTCILLKGEAMHIDKRKCVDEYLVGHFTGAWFVDYNGDSFDSSFLLGAFVPLVCTDANDVHLYYSDQEITIVQCEMRPYFLKRPSDFTIWTFTVLDNDLCIVGDLTRLLCMNYVTNTSVPEKEFLLPEKPLPLYDTICFHNKNIVVSYFNREYVYLLDFETGRVLCKRCLFVMYWTVDYTDQLIVLTPLKELRILSPLLECVHCYNAFPWIGPFVADRKGNLHVADNKTNTIVKLKPH